MEILLVLKYRKDGHLKYSIRYIVFGKFSLMPLNIYIYIYMTILTLFVWIDALWTCYFPIWYLGTGVVLDCINSWSLLSFLLLQHSHWFFINITTFSWWFEQILSNEYKVFCSRTNTVPHQTIRILLSPPPPPPSSPQKISLVSSYPINPKLFGPTQIFLSLMGA